MKYIITFFIIFLELNCSLLAQEAVVDTTSAEYKMGHAIGTYLPITVILILATFFIRKAFKFKE